MAMNHSVIMGRLVSNPEMRRTTTGKAVVSFTIACDKPGKDNGADFIPCVAWEKTGEFVNQYFLKGNPIAVEGRVSSRQYETKEGQKRTVVELVVSQAHFCGKKETADDGYTGFVKNDPAPAQQFVLLEGNDEQLPF